MIYLFTNIPKMANDIADIIRLFVDEKIKIVDTLKELSVCENTIYHNHIIDDDNYIEEYQVRLNSKKIEKIYKYDYILYEDEIKQKRYIKRNVKLSLYYCLKEIINISLPWGVLTGVRPTSLYRQLDKDENQNAHYQFKNILDVSDGKINLVEEILDAQKDIYYKGESDEIDVYIGIPFCPTRCLYCSFISHDLSEKAGPIDEYVSCVLKEINWLKEYIRANNKKIRALYIGGGTPSSIPINQLKIILEAINKLIDASCEVTLEAGRVDTIDDELLEMLISTNVKRISVNSQTMNDVTLELVNRPHTAIDSINCVHKAKAMGFVVNMDIIMGLPNEDINDMKHTLDVVKSLPLDNLTIHSLAIKRSAKIRMEKGEYTYASPKDVANIIDSGRKVTQDMGMRPYYMYRQKYMSGNLENVGYGKIGTECVYNIDIMEESHNLVAIGAGAISKRMYFDRKFHKRYANPKNIEYYIENIDRIIREKDEFYSEDN